VQIHEINQKSDNQAVKLTLKTIRSILKNFRSPSIYNSLRESTPYKNLSKKGCKKKNFDQFKTKIIL
jgi:hypothetical protein